MGLAATDGDALTIFRGCPIGLRLPGCHPYSPRVGPGARTQRKRRAIYESMNGLLVIDKPGGMTSRDVVNRVQPWFPRKTKLGHTRTLEPLATSLLLLSVG